jgi:hypothetical protein
MWRIGLAEGFAVHEALVLEALVLGDSDRQT